MSQKPLSLTDTFSEASNVARQIRSTISFFYVVLLGLVIGLSILFQHIFGNDANLINKFLIFRLALPCITTFLITLLIMALENQHMMRFLNRDAFEDYHYLNRFSNLFFTMLFLNFIPQFLLLTLAYPSIHQALHQHIFSWELLAWLAMLFIQTSLCFAFIVALLENKKPLKSLHHSFKATKRSYWRVFVINLAFMLLFYVIIILAFLDTGIVLAPQTNIISIIAFTLITALGIYLMFWILPICLCALFIAYRKLAM